MKIGFVGAGNMGGAIIRGILNRQLFSPQDILASSLPSPQLDQMVADTGVILCPDNSDLIETSEIVLLAVTPQVKPAVLQAAAPAILRRRPLLVSIAAGTSLQQLQNFVAAETSLPIIRVMPNINAQAGEGAAAVCGNSWVSKEQIDTILGIFRTFGKAWELPEKDFGIFAAIAGCSPAYACLFIDALSRAAVKHGLPKDLATRIAAQAVYGSARMVMETDDTPWDLIDKVCSPGGTTVAGLIALEDNAFVSSVIRAIDAAIAKDHELLNGQ